jgi:hypothetical protein
VGVRFSVAPVGHPTVICACYCPAWFRLARKESDYQGFGWLVAWRCQGIQLACSGRPGFGAQAVEWWIGGDEMNETLNNAAYRSEMRLLLEELCCDLCRFEHVTGEGLAPESIQIDREFWLGRPDAFADIRVVPGARPPYFVEVKYGYSRATLLAHLRLKYGQPAPGLAGVSHIILLVDTESFPDLPALKSELAGFLPQGLEVEIWNDAKFLDLVHQLFKWTSAGSVLRI